MNELLPYEDNLKSKLAGAPLPNEGRAWDAMRQMLEGDDNKNGIVPPPANGCRNGGIAMLLLVLVAAVSIVLYKMKSDGTATTALHNKSVADTNAVTAAPPASPAPTVISDTVTRQLPAKQDDGKANVNITKQPRSQKINISTPVVKGQNVAAVIKNGASAIHSKTPAPATVVSGDKGIAQTPALKDSVKPKNTGDNSIATKPANKVAAKPLETKQDSTLTPNNTTTATQKPNGKTDSATRKKPAKELDNDDNKIWFGAGVALQQLIPVNGQKAVPYYAEGRKSSLGDYIPSVYFRVYQKKKFLQVEFKYGAPQYTKDIPFEKKVLNFDSTTHITTSNISHLKKTYYHQLPVSIHYSLLPDLSIGAGVVWNKFQSAVIEQSTQRAIGSVIIDTTVKPGPILNIKKDSSFAKSYFQFMLEAQYTWKRFSLGARYSAGLQPYLTFTSPTTGKTQNERNASLNIFVRYELWQSKKR